MCGIAGYAGPRVSLDPEARALGERMCATLIHRGPDDTGVWFAPGGDAVLGHRRLSIIDLSSLGRNPMPWDGGRLQITYNGEVYNFRELRRELESEGCRFRSQTDTEVLIAAYDRWGPRCVTRFAGMFALAIWDEANRRLFLARDRFGKKPLYYALRAATLSFASELKALLTDPAFSRAIDRDALGLYLRYGYVPAPRTIFEGARKLPPGHYAIFEAGRLEVIRYWDPVAIAVAERLPISAREADERLEQLLRDAVAGRMIADVPVGAFLSGGIDSSLIVALMQELGDRPARTFTIRFDNPKYDESAHAAAVASHLGTEHHEHTCGVREMLDVVDRLPEFFDEPFADSSAIPTYLVSHHTRQAVTVALSGDGGDELFFGYPRYFYIERAGWLVDAPASVRNVVAHLAARAPWRRVRRAADVLRDAGRDRYGRFIGVWGAAEVRTMVGCLAENQAYADARCRTAALRAAEQAPIQDVVSYLPDDILTKVDRASMAVSLETRCPLLDHRVAEFALGLPLHLRTDGRTGKLPLRRLLEKRVPRTLFERPKMGFGVPLEDWFRGPLRARMDAYVRSSTCLTAMGLNPVPVLALWEAFLSGSTRRTDQLWAIFALAGWAERWKPEPVSPLEQARA